MKDTILIIEDDTDLRRSVSQILELADYNVITAGDGKRGLETARINKPDLILCDIMMPALDGYGVLRAKVQNQDLTGTPFIFITAKSGKPEFRTAMELGADDYLTKPFSGDDLLKTVSAQIKKKELLRRDFFRIHDEFTGPGKTRSLRDFFQYSESRFRKKIKKKETIFTEGEPANYLYHVISGKIKTSKSHRCGKDYLTEIYTEGDFFGYTSLLENSCRKESAMAIENSEIAPIPRHDFFQLLYSNTGLSLTLVKHIVAKLNGTEEKILQLAYDTARKKVADAILLMNQKYNPDEKSELTFSFFRENISAMTGLSRESVSRNITGLRRDGFIDTGNSGSIITIRDISKLKSLKW